MAENSLAEIISGRQYSQSVKPPIRVGPTRAAADEVIAFFRRILKEPQPAA
jgi:hypothetical protein